MSELHFTAYCHPEPQGSAKAFIVGGKARITSDNAKLKPMRSEVTRCAMLAVTDATPVAPDGILQPWAPKHEPVRLWIAFHLAKPASAGKKRLRPSVKPDLDKLIRAVKDALTGVVYADDGQVVEISAAKFYGLPESIEVIATRL